MLKSLDKKEGDERQMALAEANFYLGQHYLAEGDIKRAQAAFEQTRSLGVINYIEHAGAEYELELLKKQAQSATVSAKPAAASQPVIAH
jgi:lipoprotein NlpI